MISAKRWTAAAAMLGSLALMACEAKLVDKLGCEGGDQSCDQHDFVKNAEVVDPGTGGGAPLPMKPPEDCYADCDLMAMTPAETGEFPCEIEPIIANCQRCHSANPVEVNGTIFNAPFDLDTFEQAHTFVTDYGKVAYGIFANPDPMSSGGAVYTDFMPLQDPKLTLEEKKTLVFDWACNCAPPRPAGEVCP